MKTEKGGNKMESFFWEDKEKKYLKINLLSTTAKQKADEIFEARKMNKKLVNTHTQIRKFFDEIITYKTQCIANPSEDFFRQKLPYIKMINAKLSYAKARNLIDNTCYKFFSDLISYINDRKDFIAFADFFEAFIAFYKEYGDK